MAGRTVTAAAMRVVKLLVGNPPQTVSDLVEAAGVTRTAVTEQLNELVASGFVERDTQWPPGRGRPSHLYKATEAAMMLLFGGNQNLVVPAILRAIHEIGGEKLNSKVLRRLSRYMADHYKNRITSTTPQQRFRDLIGLLREEGGLIEAVKKNGRLVMHKRSCPFISMLDGNHTVCCVDQEMMSRIVGSRVRRTACRHDGAPCCTFEISGKR